MLELFKNGTKFYTIPYINAWKTARKNSWINSLKSYGKLFEEISVILGGIIRQLIGISFEETEETFYIPRTEYIPTLLFLK